MTVVLDAGALIAIERGHRATAAIIQVAADDGEPIIAPATVVAQAWRDGRRQVRLARVLGSGDVTVEPLTDLAARTAGSLCDATGTADIVDATVVITARRHHAVVLSSDRADLERLDPRLSVLDC